MSLEAAGLRTEYRTNPLGTDVAAPRFSWVLRSDRTNVTQRAWRVLVASSPDVLGDEQGDLWDSGWTEGGDPCHIVYAGAPLPSATRAWWTVSVTDDAGERSAWAEPAWWETGLLDADDWQHGWISAPGFRVPHLRNEFDLASPVTRARLYVTALGLYRASLNGRRVGDDWFTPGWTDYRHRVQVQTYDVTDHVVEGTNAIGLVVADGWYAGRLGWLGERCHYGTTPQVRAQLVVDHADGTRTVTGTDETWRVWSGAIIDTDFLLGETYDSRRALGPWDEVGFRKRAFLPASNAVATDGPGPDVALVASAAEPVRAHEVIAPVAVTEPFPGVWILDFGQNLVGWARLTVNGPRGDVVRLRFAEMLRADGQLYTDNLRSAQAVDSYALAGDDGLETWEPMFAFHGFRFVEVTGWPGGGPPPDGGVVAVVAHSVLEPAGTFECSHPMVNQLQSNIVWGLRGNFLEVPTDCPQRDERLGWMGDIQVFAATAAFNRDVAAFLTKWMWDVVDGQSADGGFPDVAPKVVDPQDGAPAWGDAGAIVPWRVHEWYGDTRIISTHRRAVAAWVDYIDAANPDGRWLQRRNGDMGDWLSAFADTPKDVLATAFFAHSADLGTRMAALDGDPTEAERLGAIAARARAAFVEHYVADDATVTGGTQTAYALALRFDLLPAALRAAAARHLADDVRARGFHPTVGFVGVPHLLPALTDAGHVEEAYGILLQDTFPSWGYQIANGATTMWERWDGWTAETGFQDPAMNSFNHYAFGAVGEWLYTTVAGIAPDGDDPGFRTIRLRPMPGPGLDWARARYTSIRGEIACGWSRGADGTITVDVEIPPTCTADLELPDGERHTLGSGAWSFSC